MGPGTGYPAPGRSEIPAMPARGASLDALTMGRPCCTIAIKRLQACSLYGLRSLGGGLGLSAFWGRVIGWSGGG